MVGRREPPPPRPRAPAGLGAGRPHVEQPAGLVGVLSDRSAPLGDRADAACDLALYDDDAAEAVLAAVGGDLREDSERAVRCGESLAEIWVRRGTPDVARVRSLQSEARRMAVTIMLAERPDWAAVLGGPD